MPPAHIALAIVALCIVIVVHELGHYLCAVMTGMKVDRFSIFGIGTPILRFGSWRGTEFVISAIPFGAYVQIRGMEPESEATAVPDREPGFRDKPLLARMLVLAGGPIANYLAAMMMFFGLYALAGIPGPATTIEIAAVNEASPAADAGMLAGDHLIAIGDTTIDPRQGGTDIHAATEAARGSTTHVIVERGGTQHTLDVTLPDESPTRLGIQYSATGPRQVVSPTQAASLAIAQPIRTSVAQLQVLYLLITRQISAEMSGPIGMVQALARAADTGLIAFVSFAALISTMLGFFNLLPIPALDGGRLSFLVYEAVSRRRPNPRVEELVHGYGMLVLLGLIFLVSVGDVRRLLS